jgi:hypothetical protein
LSRDGGFIPEQQAYSNVGRRIRISTNLPFAAKGKPDFNNCKDGNRPTVPPHGPITPLLYGVECSRDQQRVSANQSDTLDFRQPSRFSFKNPESV